MGAATERAPEAVLEDGLRKRKESLKSEATDTLKATYDFASSRVAPLSQAWKPSRRVQNITIWVLLLATCFFSIAVVIEELQASWYRSPALDALNSQIYGAASLDTVLKPASHVERLREILRLRWNVTWGTWRADGVETSVYLVNDKFPGPVIETRSGDTVHLDLVNSLGFEELTLHFDGLIEAGPSIPGVKGDVSQSPIVVGPTTTYEFQVPADKMGTFSYRASPKTQSAGGIFGAFIVHGPSLKEEGQSDNGIGAAAAEERVVVINQWRHQQEEDYYHVGAGGDLGFPDSILINGIGTYNCSKLNPAQQIDCKSRMGRSRPNMKFEAGKTYRLRFVNAGTTTGVTISIPGTTMTVIEVDSERVRPRRATSIGVLRPGQRVDVVASWPTGGDDEITVSLDDDASHSSDSAFSLEQSFPIRISGFLDSKVHPPTPRYIDILRLSPQYSR
jgi:hypothetical protein